LATNSTLVEIRNNVLSLLGKSDSTTANRVTNWINLGQDDFILRELWPFRETTGTLATIAGTQEYDLSTNFSDLDEQNILSVAIQGSGASKLTYWPYNQLRRDYPDFDAEAQGVPTRYYLKSGKIGLWPAPGANYSIAIDYYKLPTELSADSDQSIIPVNYREALMHYALSLEHDFNTDPDLALKEMNRYEQKVTLARQNLLSQPNDEGGFQIQGPDNSWTGRYSNEAR
jgi:hypothetical protein